MKNLELKARRKNLSEDKKTCEHAEARFVCRMKQCDTYFRVQAGRLKLREEENGKAQLITYLRPDDFKARTCDYVVIPVSKPGEVRDLLSVCLGEMAEVRKTRELYMWHRVRIHLDRVENLGSFLEFEAVLANGEAADTAAERINRLSEMFEVSASEIEGRSYLDLICEVKT